MILTGVGASPFEFLYKNASLESGSRILNWTKYRPGSTLLKTWTMCRGVRWDLTLITHLLSATSNSCLTPPWSLFKCAKWSTLRKDTRVTFPVVNI